MNPNSLEELRLSVIVPVYNGWDHVSALLSHLGPLPEDTEVIVVDDASPEEGLGPLTDRFPTVRTIRRPLNGGFAATVNTGLAVARGKTYAVLNSDLRIDSLALDALVLASESAGAVTGPLTTRPNGERIRTAYPFPHPASQPLELHPFYRVTRRVFGRVAGGRRLEWLVGSALVVPKSVVEAVGPLDENYGMYSEEVDWQHRMVRAGVPIILVEDSLAVHDETHGATRYSDSASRRHLAIWRSRRLYHRNVGGLVAEAVFRMSTICVCAAAAVVFAPLLIPRRTRPNITEELRRLAAVVRAMRESVK